MDAFPVHIYHCECDNLIFFDVNTKRIKVKKKIKEGCTVSKASRKHISVKIKECHQLKRSEKVISCLVELLEKTNSGMVAYELGLEYEKTGKNKNAFLCYEKAESLFARPDYKNMARSAINNLQIEAILSAKKKKISKLFQ